MIYNIANPSDPYTIKHDDFQVAAVAVALLGNGAYGIEGTPILIGWDAWFKEQRIELCEFMEARRADIANALDSVMIGNVSEREELEELVAFMPEEKRAAFLADRHDKRRSSMNNIGGTARGIAKRLRSLAAA